MNTAHTPGPWLVRPNGWQITNADDGLVAVTHDETEQPGLLPHPESVANAHLIAASPDMHAFIVGIIDDQYDRVSPGVKHEARRILASINGGNP